MSWYRKVKSIYSITLITTAFIIWSTLSKWLMQNPVEYKLFLIALGVVFITQYLNNKNLKRPMVIGVPLGISILASLLIFQGQSSFLNIIFLLFMILITYAMEDTPIEHSKYKEDIKKSMVGLVFIWIISFTQGTDFVNEMYKFHILYIIMIIILMRETRRYVYNVNSNGSKLTNIIIGISVVTLSLDYASIIISKVISLLMNLASFILYMIVVVLTKIFGAPIAAIIYKLKAIIIKRDVFQPGESIIDDNLNEPPTVPNYEGIELPPLLIFAFKIFILLLILYGIYRFLLRFSSRAKNPSEFVEIKERITKRRKKKTRVKDILGRFFQGGGSNRDKILSKYKELEKVTAEVDIYKPHMTATQLKNVIKLKVDNFDYLDEATDAYNEAKFSLHEMNEKQVEVVKKAHNNIKSSSSKLKY